MDIAVQRFECPVCLTNYTYAIPKILPCIHSVCERCLQDLIDLGKGKKIKCPLCREEIKVPKDGTKGFKTNIYLVPDNVAVTRTPTIACAFCADESDKPIRLPCGHALCRSCSQTKATVSHPQSTNDCPVCIEIPSYNFKQPQRPSLQSQSPINQPPGPSPTIWSGCPPPNVPPRWPTQYAPPRGLTQHVAYNPPESPHIQPQVPPPSVPARTPITDSAVLYGIPYKRPQLQIRPGQVGQTSQSPTIADQRAPIQGQVTPPVVRQLYPLERLAQVANEILQQNSSPPLPDRPVPSPLTTPETTHLTSPLEPSAPPKEEIYDDGYDSIINIPDRLEGEDFFCGAISRDESTDLLKKNGSDGYFLIRKTVKDDPSHIYTIDILYGQSDYHLKIKRRPDGRYYVKHDAIIPKHFEDVRSLIQHFRGKSIRMADRITGQEFNLTLMS